MSRWRRAFGLLAAAALSGCGQTASHHAASPPSPQAAVIATTAAPSPSPVTTTHKPRPRPTRTATPAATQSVTAQHAARQPLLVDRLVGVGSARQVVSVTSSGYGTSYATLRAFARTSHGWRQVFGPWAARIGYNGFAPSGDKREGDGRSPTGAFGFQFMFGVNADPGVRFAYRRAVRTSWWDDDSASASYNLWVDSRSGDPGRSPESMHQVPAYLYGAVIGYNVARTSGRGSAIFLHVSHTGATAGCVSIPESELLAVLRWLDPRRSPRIVMGPMSAVTH